MALAALALLAGCRSGQRVDPILQLSTQEALSQGKALLEQEKYTRALRYLEHAFEASPNSREGREALLLAADALYRDGGDANYIRCEAKYRDFLNRFPTSDQADYAQFQVANCLAERMEKPDRDQQVTREALKAYQELFRLYPTSEHLEAGRQRVTAVTDNLAESEFMVGFFYLRYKLCNGAIQRLDPLPAAYPDYSAMDKAFFHLGVAYEMCRQPDKADQVFARLSSEFPNSPYLGEIEKVRNKYRKKDGRS